MMNTMLIPGAAAAEQPALSWTRIWLINPVIFATCCLQET
jgi:hypothetical protein